MPSGKPLIALHVALFQEEKSGNEAVPRVSGKGKLEGSIEHLFRHHRPESLQRRMSAFPVKKTSANRRSRAFRDVYKQALFFRNLLLKQAKAMGMTEFEPDAP
jgi:hypothetical protein